MIKKRYEADVYSGSVLVDFCVKYDKVQEAHDCFDGITWKDLVSWNSLMLGYSRKGSSFSMRRKQSCYNFIHLQQKRVTMRIPMYQVLL